MTGTALPRSPDAAAPPPLERLNNFDLIRLFAALQVLLFHAIHRFDLAGPAALVPVGWFPGVPIFFVLSGFLITASFERSHGLADYSRKRALRIFPGLWCCITLTVVAAAAVGYSFASRQGVLWFAAQLCGLIYTPGFLKSFGVGTYNGSLWTIPIELQFYAAVPVVAWLARAAGRRTATVAAVFAVALAFAAVLYLRFPVLLSDEPNGWLKLFKYSFAPRFYLFMLGMLLYRLRVDRWAAIRGKGLAWVAAVIAWNVIVGQDGVRFLGSEILLGIAAISLAYTLPALGPRLLRGYDLSYGAYLYHGLVINMLVERSLARGWAAVGWTFAGALALAAVSWLAIEKPALRSRYGARLRGAGPAAKQF